MSFSISSSTSTSDCGNSSRRPKPPTASTATPCGITGARDDWYALHTSSSTIALRAETATAALPSDRKRLLIRSGLECGLATIFVSDPDCFCDIVYKDLTVADVSGPGRARKGLDHFFSTGGGHNQFDFDLRKQIDVVFLSAINLFMAFLTAVATNLSDGHPIDADRLERFLHLFQLERLDNRFNLLHLHSPSSLGFEIVAFFAVHTY